MEFTVVSIVSLIIGVKIGKHFRSKQYYRMHDLLDKSIDLIKTQVEQTERLTKYDVVRILNAIRREQLPNIDSIVRRKPKLIEQKQKEIN